jgi:hypothetical protein
MYLLGRGDQWKKEFSHKTRAGRRKVQMVRTMSIEPYLQEYTFFTLAPLYVHAGVGYSMPDQFEIEAGEQKRLLVDYQRTVVAGLGRWGRYVEGLATEVWDDFCHYLSTVLFVSFTKQVVWQVSAQAINVEGTADVGAVVRPRQLPVRLTVFLPDGNRGRMNVKGGYPAKLWWNKPHQRIVEMSDMVLKCQGRIESGS